MHTPRHIGTRHIHLDATDSTNNRAAEFAHDPSYAGTVFTADVQSQGRGQHGRVWHSPPGTNVLMSALLFPPAELRRPALLTAFAAVAVANVVEDLCAEPAVLKWPNDVLVEQRKIAGILIESGGMGKASSGLNVPFAIVGIGLNVNQSADDFRRGELPNATSLALQSGRPLQVQAVTEKLVRSLDDCYGQLLTGRGAELEERWSALLHRAGPLTTVELMDAGELQGYVRRIAFAAVELELPHGEMRSLRPEEIRHIR